MVIFWYTLLALAGYALGYNGAAYYTTRDVTRAVYALLALAVAILACEHL